MEEFGIVTGFESFLKALGYSKEETTRIVEHVREKGNLAGTPALKPEHLPVLEKKVRELPMVAARLRHARDTYAADAAVKELIYGDPVPIDSWRRSSTYNQVRLDFSRFTKLP